MPELLDEIVNLLKKGEKEKAFVLIKDKVSKVKNSLAEELIEKRSFYIGKEEYDFAITYFDFAYEIAIDSEIKKIARNHLTDAYNSRGNVYYGKGIFDKAIDDYNKAIEFNPEYAGAYYNRGLTYGKKGKFDTAIEDYNKAIGFNPDFADAYTNRGAAYYAKDDFDTAIEDYNKAIDLNPDDVCCL